MSVAASKLNWHPKNVARNEAFLDLWHQGYAASAIALKVQGELADTDPDASEEKVTRNMVLSVVRAAKGVGDPRAEARPNCGLERAQARRRDLSRHQCTAEPAPNRVPELSEANAEAVLDHWAAGLTLPEICFKLGVALREARSTLDKARVRGDKRADRHGHSTRPQSRPAIGESLPADVLARRGVAPPAPGRNPVTIKDLTSRQCKMPQWRDDEAPSAAESLYCGAPISPGETYCAHCAGYAHAPAQPRSRKRRRLRSARLGHDMTAGWI